MPSPTGSLRPSPGSSAGSLRRSNEHKLASSPSIAVDALVNHLLAAKRSLSSMNLVLQANEIANSARNIHQESTILAAHTTFIRNSTLDQAAILVKVRRSLQATYDWGNKDFKVLVRAMDDADSQLERTMEMLRGTMVQSILRPKGEEQKNLLDFVEEDSVHGLRDAMKKNIQELQAIQQSFDGDLLRFDTDIRDLKKAIIDSALAPVTDDTNTPSSMAELVMGMIDNSSAMAQLLSSLTKHFDMCVTAIRTTEGAAALARRRAAEVTQSQGGDGVSISGVIAEQESNMSDLEPKTEKDRAEMLRVVVQDAEEVNDVVREIQDRLAAIENDYRRLEESTSRTETAYTSVLEGYTILSGISDRLGVYLSASDDFISRWEIEKESIYSKLDDMKGMRGFYEGYASAYSSLLLEVERRRTVDDRVKAIWRTAQESVDKLLTADRASREGFRQDVGEYLPTDLWPGMHMAPRRWQVSRAKSEKLDEGTSSLNEDRPHPASETRNTSS